MAVGERLRRDLGRRVVAYLADGRETSNETNEFTCSFVDGRESWHGLGRFAMESSHYTAMRGLRR